MTQTQFTLIHLAVVGFVVVAAEMQQAVEDELLDLAFECQAVFHRLLLGLLDRDHNIAEVIFVGVEFVGLKRQRISTMPFR